MAAHQPRTPMSAGALRRRVRRITAASVGAATLAAAAMTVNLAWATDDPAASSSSAGDGSQSGTTGSPTGGSSQAPAGQLSEEESEGDGEGQAGDDQAPAALPGITTPPSAAPAPGTAQAPSSPQLVAPRQAPLAGSGRSHTQSGGS